MYSVLVLFVVELAVATYGKDLQPFCSPGFVRNDNNSCVCAHHHFSGILHCHDDTGVAELADGYCMSFDSSIRSTVVGKCLFRNYSHFEHDNEVPYNILPKNVFELDSQQCGDYHRTGILCAKCEESYGTSVTLSLECVPCRNVFGYYGRFVYVLIQVTLVTGIYLLIILFNARLTKSPMNCFILFAQVIANIVKYDTALYTHIMQATGNSFLNYYIKFVLSFYGLWDLDLFPIILPTFCIATSLKGLHRYLIQYWVAVYPLILAGFIYLLVNLYTRNVRIIVFLWRTVKCCCPTRLCCGCWWIVKRVSQQGLANSFASFLVLGYSRIIFVSVSVFLPITLYTDRGDPSTDSPVLYYDPTVKLFGPKHWPYAVIAFILILLFTFLPLVILVMYPLCAHRCSHTSHSTRFFVESFQGWFKDGTETGTRDFRLLSSLNPLMRIFVALAILLVTVLAKPSSYIYFARWLVVGLAFTAAALLFALLRPYKYEYMNISETLLYMLLGVICFLASYRLGIYFTFVLCPLPMLAFLGYGVYVMIKKARAQIKSYFERKFKPPFVCGTEREHERLLSSDSEGIFPHRLEEPGLYTDHSTSVSVQHLGNYPP